MPQAIVIYFVWFPDLVVKIENHMAILQLKIHPISLENRMKQRFFKSDQVLL